MDLKAINLGTSNKIVKDECYHPCIYGKRGKIYQDDEHWYIYLKSRNWNDFKKKLSFMQVWQDGDSEGVLRLNRPLSDKEASKVRKIGEFGKKKKMSAEQRDMMKKHFFKPVVKDLFPVTDALKSNLGTEVANG